MPGDVVRSRENMQKECLRYFSVPGATLRSAIMVKTFTQHRSFHSIR